MATLKHSEKQLAETATQSIRGDFAKTDCSQKRIFRLKAKKIKKYAKPNHGIFLFRG